MREEIIGDCRLALGDCREVMASFPPCFRVGGVVTDPPYGVGFKYESHDDRPEAYDGGYGIWLWSILETAETFCVPGSPVFVWQASPNLKNFHAWFPRNFRLFIAAKNFVQMRPTAMQWAYDPVVVWWVDGEKPWSAGSATRDWCIANTAPIIADPRNLEKGHPCPRPYDQVAHLVEQWIKPDTAALDPFMGSGTTGVACAMLGRKFLGIEKEPKYFDIACRRIEEAYRQPRLFAEPEPKATQEILL